MFKRADLIVLAVGISSLRICGQGNTAPAGFDIVPHLDACNVKWDVPGPTSAQSMPIGNGRYRA